MRVRREDIERYTLGITGEIRMRLEMEHQHLRENGDTRCLMSVIKEKRL